MSFLFIHPILPSQFTNLLQGLEYAAPGACVHAICSTRSVMMMRKQFSWVRTHAVDSEPMKEPLLASVTRAEAVIRVCHKLKSEGKSFDFIVVHTGWGDGLFLRDMFPEAKIIAYNEAYYSTHGAEVNFDPEFVAPERASEMLRLRNMPLLSQLDSADWIWTPSLWQQARLPKMLQSKAMAIPEGVDVRKFSHDEQARFIWQKHEYLRGQQLVTFTARGLEPHRGFHTFMRAVPDILAGNDEIKILVAGSVWPSYGPLPTGYSSWKEKMLDELTRRENFTFNPERLVFLDTLSYDDYAKLLKVSACHVHLSYPYSQSWSLLEAMSVGCHIVANFDGPAGEVLSQERADQVGFTNSKELAYKVLSRLGNSLVRSKKGRAASTFIHEYFRKEDCVKRQLGLLGFFRRDS